MQGDDTAAVIEVSPYRISDYCPRTSFIRTQTGDRVISSPVPPDSCSRALAGGALSAAKDLEAVRAGESPALLLED